MAKSVLLSVSKDQWDKKEDTSKSVKNVLYLLYNGVAKGTFWDKVK